jgi:hypothetical protein
VRPLLYNLPELEFACTVVITEGEKDTNRVTRLKLLDTTRSEIVVTWRNICRLAGQPSPSLTFLYLISTHIDIVSEYPFGAAPEWLCNVSRQRAYPTKCLSRLFPQSLPETFSNATPSTPRRQLWRKVCLISSFFSR